jgi:hypothetical protein
MSEGHAVAPASPNNTSDLLQADGVVVPSDAPVGMMISLTAHQEALQKQQEVHEKRYTAMQQRLRSEIRRLTNLLAAVNNITNSALPHIFDGQEETVAHDAAMATSVTTVAESSSSRETMSRQRPVKPESAKPAPPLLLQLLQLPELHQVKAAKSASPCNRHDLLLLPPEMLPSRPTPPPPWHPHRTRNGSCSITNLSNTKTPTTGEEEISMSLVRRIRNCTIGSWPNERNIGCCGKARPPSCDQNGFNYWTRFRVGNGLPRRKNQEIGIHDFNNS